MIRRKIEKMKENKWVEILMQDLKIGDKFRLFEPPNFKEVVKGQHGEIEFIVKSEPFRTKENAEVWSVNCD